jgi:hypothetical protein
MGYVAAQQPISLLLNALLIDWVMLRWTLK